MALLETLKSSVFCTNFFESFNPSTDMEWIFGLIILLAVVFVDFDDTMKDLVTVEGKNRLVARTNSSNTKRRSC